MRLKQQFNFSRGEQWAIVVLILAMLLFAGINFIPLDIPAEAVINNHQLDSILSLHKTAQDQQEQLRQRRFDVANPEVSAAADKLNPFKFNPNRLPESEWKKLGFADYQIRNIKNYELKGGKFFRKEDLKKIYTVSEAEYKLLEPYIIIPTTANALIAKSAMKSQDAVRKPGKLDKPKTISDVELNSADSLELIQLPQIGPWFAHRILKYRKILGGYIHKNQLLEVYGMEVERLEQFDIYVNIDTTKVEPLRINYVDFKQLVRHPYISYELAKAIFNQRERKGMINNWQTVKHILPEGDSLSVYLPKYLNFN